MCGIETHVQERIGIMATYVPDRAFRPTHISFPHQELEIKSAPVRQSQKPGSSGSAVQSRKVLCKAGRCYASPS